MTSGARLRRKGRRSESRRQLRGWSGWCKFHRGHETVVNSTRGGRCGRLRFHLWSEDLLKLSSRQDRRNSTEKNAS